MLTLMIDGMDTKRNCTSIFPFWAKKWTTWPRQA